MPINLRTSLTNDPILLSEPLDSVETLEQSLEETVKDFCLAASAATAFGVVWSLEALLNHPDCCGASLPQCVYRRMARQWRYIAFTQSQSGGQPA